MENKTFDVTALGELLIDFTENRAAQKKRQKDCKSAEPRNRVRMHAPSVARNIDCTDQVREHANRRRQRKGDQERKGG